MINCTCVDCEKTHKFKDLQEARDAKWIIWGINISENEFKASCRTCDTTISPKKNINNIIKKKDKLINYDTISYD
jgi:hypothetical protein